MSDADAPRDGIFWLASYPKSGNTWFRSFLTALLHGGDAVDINALAANMAASSRSWLDDVLAFDTADLRHDEIDTLRGRVYGWRDGPPALGYHKTHDAFRRSPGQISAFRGGRTLGALYLIRNPLDIAPSLAHHNGTSVDRAIADMADPHYALCRPTRRLLPQVPQHMGSWSQHVSSWVDGEDCTCIVLRYEDMHADAPATFAAAARFLGLTADDAAIARAVRATAFAALRDQERVRGFDERPAGLSQFFRQGTSGAWRTQLSEAQVQRITSDHAAVMRRFAYIDDAGIPL
uniref:sulfotransferase domain-containing protein n=1 Tax=uncultured Sphingomonas sp. TaxID=158754 RepID=UPI0035CB0DD8